MISTPRIRQLLGVSLVALTAFAGGAVVTGSMPSAMAQEVQAQSVAVPQGASLADLIERVSPAVVSINVRVQAPVAGVPGMQGAPNLEQLPPQFREWLEREFGGQPQPQMREGLSLGSGFFISEDGYVVTNNHVIEDATEITVVLSDGEEFNATVVGTDPLTDIALLEVDNPDDRSFPFVRLNTDPTLRVGDWVVAVGNPFGLGGTATFGIISALGRESRLANYNEFIQIDAPINRGNSGGPTFDMEGNVIGVNSQILSPTGGNIGIGFAIPSDVASEIVNQLIETGRVSRGWLGVQIQDVTEDIADSVGLDSQSGAIVSSLVSGGPAASAGLRRGDVILAMNGEDVESANGLTRRVGAARANEEVRFTVLRDGREQTIRVRLGDRPSEQALNQTPNIGEPEQPQTYFGMTLTPSLDETDVDGLLVANVEPRSEAAEKGLRPGDIIVEAGGATIQSVSDLTEAVDDARGEGRPAILLLVQNGGAQRYIALQLDGF
ncbi:MAG: Do family serine endopeptidase [Alphaproteobacteria bacterium]|nr:Do family serine endopeptidase [Alphaproteobacteria bacterium]